jgi:hypothetical protein
MFLKMLKSKSTLIVKCKVFIQKLIMKYKHSETSGSVEELFSILIREIKEDILGLVYRIYKIGMEVIRVLCL